MRACVCCGEALEEWCVELRRGEALLSTELENEIEGRLTMMLGM